MSLINRMLRSLFPIILCEFVIISFGFVLMHFGGAATTRHYELGTVYKYEYVLGMELNEPNPDFSNNATESTLTTGSTVGYKVLSEIHVTPIWQSQPGAVILEIKVIYC